MVLLEQERGFADTKQMVNESRFSPRHEEGRDEPGA